MSRSNSNTRRVWQLSVATGLLLVLMVAIVTNAGCGSSRIVSSALQVSIVAWAPPGTNTTLVTRSVIDVEGHPVDNLHKSATSEGDSISVDVGRFPLQSVTIFTFGNGLYQIRPFFKGPQTFPGGDKIMLTSVTVRTGTSLGCAIVATLRAPLT